MSQINSQISHFLNSLQVQPTTSQLTFRTHRTNGIEHTVFSKPGVFIAQCHQAIQVSGNAPVNADFFAPGWQVDTVERNSIRLFNGDDFKLVEISLVQTEAYSFAEIALQVAGEHFTDMLSPYFWSFLIFKPDAEASDKKDLGFAADTVVVDITDIEDEQLWARLEAADQPKANNSARGEESPVGTAATDYAGTLAPAPA